MIPKSGNRFSDKTMLKKLEALYFVDHRRLSMRGTLRSGVLIVGLGLLGRAGSALAQETRTFSGVASYYDKKYSGKTASGELYDGTKFTAAHRTLPFGTRVVVTDNKTKRSVTVRVNDRGPFIKGRVIDLSYAAASEMRMHARGLAQVTAQVTATAQ